MRLIKNQRGQGSTEYILIVALAVAVVLGGVYQLNSAFRVFADNYFGEYLSCLLETGELPSLGGEVADGICASEFKPFSLADGAPKVGAPIGEGGDEDPNKNGGSGEPEPSDVKGGSGGSGSAEGSAGSNSAFAGRGGRGARTRVRPSKGSGGDEDENSSSSSSSGSAFAQGYDSGKGTRSLVRYPEGYRGRRGGRFEQEEDKRTKVATATVDTRRNDGQAVMIKVRARTVATVMESESVDLSAGNLLRYLIIFIIIIAILIFIGGQALQVSKNS